MPISFLSTAFVVRNILRSDKFSSTLTRVSRRNVGKYWFIFLVMFYSRQKCVDQFNVNPPTPGIKCYKNRSTLFRVFSYAVTGDVTVVLQSVERLSMDWTVQESNPGRGEIFRTNSGAHPSSCNVGIGSIPGVKRPGRGVDHPTSSNPEVVERVELYLYSPSGPSWPVTARTLPNLSIPQGL